MGGKTGDRVLLERKIRVDWEVRQVAESLESRGRYGLIGR